MTKEKQENKKRKPPFSWVILLRWKKILSRLLFFVHRMDQSKATVLPLHSKNVTFPLLHFEHYEIAQNSHFLFFFS